ncbi:TetR/AcrR family transcriptional regulator [Acetonema longum]|uniref:Transcriptional regulator, TetR family protein n=1 Tax=Acetonema longum DSM 6540 TaxID=1009370 RepID=F7NH53_9FIRM|nr:TetR/AcrR family transcriptional regulator [Acetonema longum]EGO64633.1 transcriptional regulator, TetR family protein [Acetonema longum DSM 6540]
MEQEFQHSKLRRIQSITVDIAQILKAAAEVINTEGVLSLTLEAVAKKAAVSKGGLLYHFPNKDALLEGMVDYLTQSFVHGIHSAVNADPCEKGKWIRAYTILTFTQINAEMNTAFLAAAATNPELLKSMAERFQALHVHIENDNIDPILATIVRLAADGMYFNQLYGMDLQEDIREKILDQLITLTRGENQ